MSLTHLAANKSMFESENTAGLRIGYIMSRFPKLTETFILNEISMLESIGVEIEIYPLLREKQAVAHPEVMNWIKRAHFHPFISLAILQAHVHFIRRKPKTYFRLWYEVLQETVGSLNFFIGALGIFPKAVRFAYEMRRRGVTHVHAHFASHPAVAALIINRLTGIPFSFTAHGSDLHVDRRMLDTKVNAAAFAVTVSEFNKEIMVGECGEAAREKIHVVHCGVDPDLFNPRAEHEDAGDFRILCVASFEDVKGHRFLVEACRILDERRVRFHCDFVGDGPLRGVVQTQIALAGLTERVHICGPKARPDVISMLAKADVVALASHPTKQGKREGIPVALMEAMACGVPVVSTSISGIPELVDSGLTGILVPPRDAAALAEALEKLGTNPPLRGRMGKAGREKVMREFNLHRTSAQLLGLFSGYSSEAASRARPERSRTPPSGPYAGNQQTAQPPASQSL
jgi:colanic acid/amylovoran biosynthesis glycosyltransferase